MAPKRSTVLDNPPSVSPSLEESESEKELSEHLQNHNPTESEQKSSNEEESEEEEEGQPAEPLSDDDDDSGSDSPASPTASDFTVKPIISKPMKNSKPSAASKAAPGKAEGQTKGKSLNKGESVSQKKPLITRIWDEDSEIAILKGFHEYRTKKGLDPYADTKAFHRFMQKVLKFEVTTKQLMSKIRTLKKKFENNSKRGSDPTFSKPHAHKTFELSKKIWGEPVAMVEGCKIKKRKGESINKECIVEKSNIKVKKGLCSECLNVDVAGFWDKYPRLKQALEAENAGFFSKDGMTTMKLDLSKIGDAKCKAIEGKWKMFQAKEAELKLLKLDLVKEQTQMLFDALMKP